jgi:hypothetical protein
MINLDTTLQNVRRFNSNYARLLFEAEEQGFQSMEDFYDEVKRFYAEQGVTVSDKVIKFIVDVFGAESANNPQMAQIGKSIFKNPKRFLSTVEKALGVNAPQLAQKIDDTANQNDNPQVVQALTQLLGVMEKIEQHASGSHSVLDTISTDLYDIKQNLVATAGRAAQSVDELEAQQGLTELVQAMKEIVPELQRIAKAQLNKNEPSAYDGQDLSNDDLKFFQNGQLIEGRVLLDSDSPLLSQEVIDGINNGKNPPWIVETIEEIKQMPHTVWVYVGGKVYVVKKSTIPDINLVGKMAEFIPQATEEVKSLLKLPKIFFQPVSGERKQDEKTRRQIGKAAGRFEYQQDKITGIMNKYGMRPMPHEDDEQEGEWYTPLKGGVENTPAIIVIKWVMENKPDSGITIEDGNLNVTGGKLVSGMFTNNYLTVRFSSGTRGYDASTITSMDVKNIDVPALIQFCKSRKINAEDQSKQVLVRNNFLR